MVNKRFLEMALKMKNETITEKKEEQNIKMENVLVFSCGKDIYLYDRDGEVKFVKSGNDLVSALCSHKGKLYEGRGQKIFETFSRQKIATRDEKVRVLCSHNGKLYDGGEHYKIFETFSNTEIVRRNNHVYALCSHEGVLYDGGGFQIFETFSNKPVADRTDYTYALCSHEGVLYDSGRYKKIFATFSNTEVVKPRDETVWCLCSQDKKLYDGGSCFKVFDTFASEEIVIKDKSILAMCSHPREDFVNEGILRW